MPPAGLRNCARKRQSDDSSRILPPHVNVPKRIFVEHVDEQSRGLDRQPGTSNFLSGVAMRPQGYSRGRAAAACIVVAALCTGVAPSPAAAAWRTTDCYPIDTVAPVVHTLTMSPTSVDVRTVGRLVTVTATATDANAPGKPVSGVDSILVTLLDRSSTAPLASRLLTRALSLTSGTRTDGTWGVQFAIEPWLAGGAAGQTWALVKVEAADVSGNFTRWSRPAGSALSGPQDIAKTSWTPGIAVFSMPDVTAPTITAWSFSPSSVNTNARAAKLT